MRESKEKKYTWKKSCNKLIIHDKQTNNEIYFFTRCICMKNIANVMVAWMSPCFIWHGRLFVLCMKVNLLILFSKYLTTCRQNICTFLTYLSRVFRGNLFKFQFVRGIVDGDSCQEKYNEPQNCFHPFFILCLFFCVWFCWR